MRKTDFLPIYAKTKVQIRFAVTANLISAFVCTTRIVQFLLFLNPKFQASSLLLCLYRPVYDRSGRKPKFLVFSRTGSHENFTYFPAPQEHGVLSVKCLNFSLLVEFQTLAGGCRALDWNKDLIFNKFRLIFINLANLKLIAKNQNFLVFKQYLKFTSKLDNQAF